MTNRIETAWLIEFQPSVSVTPSWMAIDDPEESPYMTTDSLYAMRFSRKQDAEAMIKYFGWTEAFASEHQWS